MGTLKFTQKSRAAESESDFQICWSRSRESDFQICWSRSRTFLVRKQCKRVGSRSRWSRTFLGERSRIFKFAGVGVGSRILKFAGVGLFPSDSAALFNIIAIYNLVK